MAAVQAVLRKLLPESGWSIKGETRTYLELYEASGFVQPEKRFEGLLRILDTETKLITLTEKGRGMEVPAAKPQGGFYQLSHDSLVAPVRMWLNRKQGATASGRAELRLSDYSAFWSEKPEDFASAVDFCAF